MVDLVEYLIASGTISINAEDGTAAVIKSLDKVNTQIPEHIYAKVTAIMDSLSPPVQTAARIASVCSEMAPLAMIIHIRDILMKESGPSETKSLHTIQTSDTSSAALATSGQQMRDVAKLMQDLSELETNGFVRFSMGSDAVEFVEETIRLVVFNTILPSHRVVIHECAIVWYEKYCPAYKRGQFQYNAVLAGHLLESGNIIDALEHYELAAEQSLLTGCIAESLECLTSALLALEAMGRDPKTNKGELEMRTINLLYFFSQASILNHDLRKATRQLREVVSRGEIFEKRIRKLSGFFNHRIHSSKEPQWDKKICSQLVSVAIALPHWAST